MTETNATLQLLKEHTSVRSYLDLEVSAETRNQILEAARHASTSCYLQVTSVIRISDMEKRRQISEITTQPHVLKAPEMWIFCADLGRIQSVFPDADLGWMEQFLMSCQDIGIFAQNVMIALESLGLGGVYAGAIRNDLAKVCEILELPHTVMPIVGICFGYPANRNEIKPRLPLDMILMENSYQAPAAEKLQVFDDLTRDYYANRSVNSKHTCWSKDVARIFQRERRFYLKEFLESRGWCKK